MGLTVTTIRPFELSDVKAAAEMEASHQLQPWTEAVFLGELAAENRTYLVADEGGFAGFAGVMVIGDEAHITNLLVGPDRRRQGVGRRLMKQLIQVSVGQGARHLTLEVRSENSEARQFYSQFGLVPVGARPDYYGDDDALIMWAHDIDRPGYLEGLR
jgi:ribosomal-protein-alanine N-acetyltransferase